MIPLSSCFGVSFWFVFQIHALIMTSTSLNCRCRLRSCPHRPRPGTRSSVLEGLAINGIIFSNAGQDVANAEDTTVPQQSDGWRYTFIKAARLAHRQTAFPSLSYPSDRSSASQMIVAPLLRLFSAISAIALLAKLLAGTTAHPTELVERTVPGYLTWASSLTGCPCPNDTHGNVGVLINIFPGYQCAYPSGACAWDDASGDLQNTAQGNCPANVPCPASGCTCPADLNGDAGVLINNFRGWQCGYPSGICTYDQFGNVSTVASTSSSACEATTACSILS
ncbi:hypothetical protein NEOLEDRAFT_660260 [Neolentinus lepideus HHB14362 ss-1]|uniref:Osmotin, thaumatin-like protein n=1 Tax=Neolentinus lepideus HHB14362 ss-1 TaxID=1314782 RepID=A0A165QGI7_9AGAM|nr:hypothetical protein NEOLEDRAFT_660260 [Neolentinus lepideus HHB14362 ss-1]